MGISVTKTGPYFASGEIKFSQLRTNFKETSSGEISASELFRNLNLYSKSYLNHLINSNEILASMILTLHNLKFYWELMSAIRNSIKNGQFDQFFNKYIDLL